MIRITRLLLALVVPALALLAPSVASATVPAAAWGIWSAPYPTNLPPGSTAELQHTKYMVSVVNIGGATSTAPAIITDELPIGLTPDGTPFVTQDSPEAIYEPSPCVVSGQTVTCTISRLQRPGEAFKVEIPIDVEAGLSGTLVNRARVEGGAAQAATQQPTEISPLIAPFDFIAEPAGLNWSATAADGQPVTQAGEHPYETTIAFSLPLGKFNENAGEYRGGQQIKDVKVDLPAGMVVDPSATPVKCSEAQLENPNGNACPLGSQVGTITVFTLGAGPEHVAPLVLALFNMRQSPGRPAELGFLARGLGGYNHIGGGIRTGSDYGISATSFDIYAGNPILGVRTTLWGDPSDPSHDGQRGNCTAESAEVSAECAAAEGAVAPGSSGALLRMPTACPGSLTLGAQALSWQEANEGVLVPRREAAAPALDSEGDPVTLSGCNRLPFSPALSTKPTTDVGDSPTGLDVDVHFPQQGLEEDEALAEADLQKAVVTLPRGLRINPSSANGLGACTEEQIGYIGKEAALNTDRYTPDPAECPDASKIGTVEVDTPLLKETNEAGEPTSEHPVPGSVYVARPIDNPFGSLLAIYIAVDDPKTGIVIKLAGEVQADPTTGQLTTTVESPQQPFSDFHLDFFQGAAAALRSPSVCGRYQTTSDFTPWSSPEGADASPSDSFEITRSPLGANCPTSEAALPSSPGFEAGTVTPKAGAFSPFVLHLARPDGTQEIDRIETTLPEGLLAKLAGVTECSDAAIGQAESRNKIGEGALEIAHSSCPASSEVGIVHVGAGAGPAPFYVSGHAYLAGPYKGAPLSLEIITPAVAGPYDLGTVAVRTALQVDPLTTQVHAVSDPIPHILQGIPLDVRSISLELGRNQFTLNPTSCAQKAIFGSTGSVLGDSVSLQAPFQVGECKGLAFAPKLSITLKGSTKHAGHPALKAVVTYPNGGGYANIARVQVNLPHSEFIDQGNLNKTCTRPVLLEGKCPGSTIYGTAKAWSPLLAAPLEGPVYLVGGFGYKLPALVAELNGQIRVLLVGKVDSGKNHGIRTTFETVPDAPVERFELKMKGGPKYSLLENSEPLCAAPQRAAANFTAQNGLVDKFSQPIQLKCPEHAKAKKKGHKKKNHGRH